MSKCLDRTEDEAAGWDARLRGAKSTFRDRREHQLWLREAPLHQETHDRLQAMLFALRAGSALPELSALRDEARGGVEESRRRRRSIFAAIAAAIVLAVMVVLGVETDGRTEISAKKQGGTIYATSPDERTKVTLADGSVITLDAATRVSVLLGKARRDITLLAGRALFQVAKDRTRPFVVKAGDRTITALGTVFDVRLSAKELRVTLAEGTVAVRPVGYRPGLAEQIMKPHQQLVEALGAISPELRTIDSEKAISWADGQVFFENEPLSSAVVEMNEYSRLKIVVDPAVADLRINGMFRTSNQAGFLEALQVTLPVDVHSDGNGQLIISRRPDPAAE
ncbi:FecR domain-containing protein [Sphingomonas sp. JC676]|uniref:FecR family protein n=1 Tax=Sphingomonas sp. JC676 TaxID=2768065 RepID=UPI001657E66A|nr:FecR domain-containing protein [Sphingomonas sp. JC676]MBC9031171.1 FecR domain-containing protein [Sphingomonas sp. JC676]